MSRTSILIVAAVLALSGCDSYRALLLRDGPFDLNDQMLKGNVVVDDPAELGFTYPARIHKPLFALGGKAGMIGWDLSDDSTIYWTAVTGATEYRLYIEPVTVETLTEEGWSHYPRASWSSFGSAPDPIAVETNSIALSQIAAVVPDARSRLNRTFDPRRKVGDEGLLFRLQAKVHGLWTIPTSGETRWFFGLEQEVWLWF